MRMFERVRFFFPSELPDFLAYLFPANNVVLLDFFFINIIITFSFCFLCFSYCGPLVGKDGCICIVMRWREDGCLWVMNIPRLCCV